MTVLQFSFIDLLPCLLLLELTVADSSFPALFHALIQHSCRYVFHAVLRAPLGPSVLLCVTLGCILHVVRTLWTVLLIGASLLSQSSAALALDQFLSRSVIIAFLPIAVFLAAFSWAERLSISSLYKLFAALQTLLYYLFSNSCHFSYVSLYSFRFWNSHRLPRSSKRIVLLWIVFSFFCPLYKQAGGAAIQSLFFSLEEKSLYEVFSSDSVPY